MNNVMREIKFRAWVDNFCLEYNLGKESVMFYSDRANTTYMTGDRNLKCCGDRAPRGVIDYFFNNPKIPVMQYTGLKDFNDKEIYEGDILSYIDNDNLTEDFQEAVYWSEEKGCYQTDSSEHVWSDVAPLSIVVGNVYENPELLEEANS